MAESFVKFHVGTYAEYAAKKTAGTLVAEDLYFTTGETCQIFRGPNIAADAVKIYTGTAPALAAMQPGVLYIDKVSGQITANDGSATPITLIPKRVSAMAADTDASLLPNVGAIRGYVQSMSSGGFVSASYINTADKINTLEFVSAAGTKSYVAIPQSITNVTYAPTTGKFVFTKSDGTNIEADTPLEKILVGASYDPKTHVLTLSMNTAGSPSDIPVDLSGLVDVFSVAAAADSGLAVTSANGVFTINTKLADASLVKSATGLNVQVSATADNQLSLTANGLFVAKPAAVDLTPYAKLAELAATAAGKGANLVGVSGTYAATAKTVEGVLANHESRTAAAEGTIITHTAQIAKATGDITALDTRLGTAEGKITTLEGKMSTAEGNINTLTTNVASLSDTLKWKPI